MPELVRQEIVRARVALVLVDFGHFAAGGVGGTVFFLPGVNLGCRLGEGCFCGSYAGRGLGGGLSVSGEGACDEENLIWKVSRFVLWLGRQGLLVEGQDLGRI